MINDWDQGSLSTPISNTNLLNLARKTNKCKSMIEKYSIKWKCRWIFESIVLYNVLLSQDSPCLIGKCELLFWPAEVESM
ncbi:hypothetical protein EYC84_011092 [Monilinia fructicola]|uniref:Uncharacterized protein n=1 Tax=Monilinia fructicola TaxID=38448 RepID=A0A5M9JDW8_MONFR|nr:hypothetical protein EYC84_011092 [Monilinia fructicola]